VNTRRRSHWLRSRVRPIIVTPAGIATGSITTGKYIKIKEFAA